MIFTETRIKDVYIIDVKKLEDERGFFGRSWCKRELASHGLNAEAVQANVSYNKVRGTLRGMHYQKVPYSETKTIRCTSGRIYDVVMDIRPESKTYLQWMGVELSAESFRMLYVPEGFAHGFITLEDHTSVHYMVTAYYTPGAEAGIRYDDPTFRVDWPMEPVIVSEKDKSHPPFMPEQIGIEL